MVKAKGLVFVFGLIVLLFINGVDAVQYANCAAVPLAELGGKPCVNVNSCSISFSSNTFYLLTQNVQSDGTCFIINLGVNNVTLNLNEYTVIYANNPPWVSSCSAWNPVSVSGYVCSYGIRYYGDYAKITNGKINQSTTWQGGLAYSPSITGGGRNAEISYINISTHSNDTVIIEVGGVRSRVHHNYILSAPNLVVTERCWSKSAIQISNAVGSHVYENTIIGVPQTGIHGTIRPNDMEANFSIYNNYISHNNTAPNGYGIGVSGINSSIYNNTIISTNGRGIHTTRAGMNIHDNFVNVTTSYAFQYYICDLVSPTLSDVESFTHGIKVEGSANSNVYNNIVYSFAGPSLGGAAALDITAPANSNVKIYNNLFAAFFPDRPFVSSYPRLYLGAAVHTIGTSDYDTNVELYNNTFMSNHFVVSQTWDPSGGYTFTNNTIILLDSQIPRVNSPARFMNADNTGAHSYIFLNNTIINISSRNADIGDSDYTVRWFLNVVALDGISPANGAIVTIADRPGNIVYNNAPTTNGRFNTALTEFTKSASGGPITTTEYNNYTINVTYLGETISKQVNLTNSQTLTFNFNSGPCPDANTDGKVNIVDLAITIFNQGRNALDVNYDHLDFDADGQINWDDVSYVMNRMGMSC